MTSDAKTRRARRSPSLRETGPSLASAPEERCKIRKGECAQRRGSILVGADELGKLGARRIEQDELGPVLLERGGGLKHAEEGAFQTDGPRAAHPRRHQRTDLDGLPEIA